MVINLKKFLTALFGGILIVLGMIFLLYGVFGMEKNNSKTEKAETAEVSVAGEIDADRPMIALTYDDGPYGPVTCRILEALKKVNGKATFFVVGNRIEGREETVKKIVEYGCEIGNHTYTHYQLNVSSADKIKNELKQTDDTVMQLTGFEIKVVRPPQGCYNKTTLACDSRPFILWTIDTMDWSHQNADITIKRVLDNVKDGDIILMHDLFTPTADASERLIPELAARGYQLVTVSELLEYRQETKSVVMNNG